MKSALFNGEHRHIFADLMKHMRFSLLHLLVAVTLICLITFGAVALFEQRLQRYRAEIRMDELGFEAYFDEAGNVTLVTPRLNGSGINFDDIEQLRRYPSLRTLVLSSTLVQDRHANKIAALAGLTGLALNDTGITDQAVKEISGKLKLRYLHLARTRVTDSSIRALAQMKCLEELDLAGTSVTPRGYERLRQQLPGTDIFVDDSVKDDTDTLVVPVPVPPENPIR